MSIIYEALKKVEKNQAAEPAVVQKKQSSKTAKTSPAVRPYLLYVFLACVLVFALNLTLQNKNPKQASIHPVKQPVSASTSAEKAQQPLKAVEPLPAPKKGISELLILNGVFFSGKEGYAIINNQIVKKGDVVEGALIKKIELGLVEVEYEGKIVVLKQNKSGF